MSARISDLPSASAATGALFEIEQAGVSRSVTDTQLAADIGAVIPHLDPSSNLSDIANPATALNNLGAPFSVATLAAFRALTVSPPSISCAGMTATADGWGGVFALDPLDAVTADDGALTIVNAAGKRYKRIYSGGIDVRWFGAKGDGVTNDRNAINAAFAKGGTIILGGGKTYVGGRQNVTVPGTVIDGLGTATMTDAASEISGMFQLQGDDITVQNLKFQVTQSPSLDHFLHINGNRFTIKNCRFTGSNYNPNTPNLPAYPFYGIYIDTANNAIYQHGVLENVVVVGGNSGILVGGSDRLTLNNVTVAYCANNGLGFSNGLPSTNIQATNLKLLGCGLYGLTFANLTSSVGTTFAYPFARNQFKNVLMAGCGYATYYGGRDASGIGGGKSGADLTTTDQQMIDFEGMSYNNCQGVEIKHTTPSSPPTITPQGFYNGDITLYDYTDFDFGFGLALVHGIVNFVPSTTGGNFRLKGGCTFRAAPAWTAGLTYQPLSDFVTSGGYVWQCFGTPAAGVAGVAGATAPVIGSSGSTAQAITSASTVVGGSGNVLTFASTTGIAVGQTVFAGPNLPDGTKVSAVTSTTVTLSAFVTGTISSGTNILFTNVVNDGNLNWVNMGAAVARATKKQGLQIDSMPNVTVKAWESANCRYGAAIATADSSDHALDSCWLHGLTTRNCDIGLGYTTSGAGGVTNLHVINPDIEAVSQGILFGCAGTTNDLTVSGGRIHASAGNAIQIGNGSGSTGTTTLTLDGGLILRASQICVFVDVGGTTTGTCGAVTFKTDSGGNTPVHLGGAGSFNFGNAICDNGNPSAKPGYEFQSGATITVAGRLLRRDMTTAPTTTTKGNVGEYMVLAVPTTTEWGYFCQAADFVTPLFTWKKLALS